MLNARRWNVSWRDLPDPYFGSRVMALVAGSVLIAVALWHWLRLGGAPKRYDERFTRLL